MKELSIEQKDKRYDEALKRAKAMIKVAANQDEAIGFTNTIFPELKESEDEKTKRILHSISSKMSFHLRDIFTEEEFQCFDAWSNAWLEKQEQKSQGKSALEAAQEEKVDNQNCVKPAEAEPKFKVGDIVKDPYGDVYHIVEISNDSYKTDDGRFILFENEDAYSLWTIKDAKDGDILVCKSDKQPFIFKGFDRFHLGCPVAYCGICGDGIFQACKGDGWRTDWWTDEEVFPATKEQRDLLFQKMKEAAYGWDAEKLELRKIAQKPAWSEEDEYQINTILHGLDLKRELYKKEGNKIEEDRYNTQYNWLKSLKNRVHPQQEKERILEKLEEWLDEYISNLADVGTDTLIGSFRKYLDGKLPVKPKSQWKPSDE